MEELLNIEYLKWTLPLALAYFAILALIYNYRFKDKKGASSFFKRLLTFVFIAGFLLYLTGYSLEHGGFLNIGSWALSLYSTARLFILGNDLIEIKGVFHEHLWLLFGFSLVMATVAFVFIAIFLNLVIQHLNAQRRISRNNETDANYIFLGINNAALALATDLLKKKPERLVIFVQNSKKHEDQLLFHKASKLGAVVISKESFFDKLSIKNEEFLVNVHEDSATENEISFYENNFLKIHKLLDCMAKRETHLFILSENEERNTFAAQSIIQELEARKSGAEVFVKIYVRTILQSYLEDQFFNCNVNDNRRIQVRFVNDSSIAAQQLVLNHPPVKFVDPDTSLGKARKDFTPLIIGFGQVGQACFRKLIEMGQFVDKEFRATVVDQNMSKIKGRFCFNYPGLTNYEIQYKEVQFGHPDFYELISDNREKLMYVVVSLGSDNLNMQTALEISIYAKRNDLDFKIFIHLIDRENFSHLLKKEPDLVWFGDYDEIFCEENVIRRELENDAIRNHNNYVNHSDPDRNVKPWVEIGKMKQISNISAMEHQPTKLMLLGMTEAEIAKFKNEEEFVHKIGKDRLMNLAKAEHLRWNANYFVHGWNTWSLDKVTGKSTSDEVRKLHTCLVDWETLDLVEKLFYELKKYDVITVKKIYQQIIDKEKRNLPLSQEKYVSPKELIIEQEIQRFFIEDMAKAVHNRWMAGRVVDGWKYGPTRDDQKKEHPGIVPYEKLPEEEKEVDRQTVKATLSYLIENGYEIRKN